MRRRRGLSTLAAAIVVLAGCGGGTSVSIRSSGSDDEGSTTQPTSGWTRTTVYFLIDDGAAPIGVRRPIRMKSPYAWEALGALLAGPSDKEREAGVKTAIPSSALPLSVSFRGTTAHGGTEAIVDISGIAAVTDGLRKARIISQVARTLIGLSDVDRVSFRSDGQPWGLDLIGGGVDDGPFDYRTLNFDIGSACAGTETVVCDRFVGLP